MHRTGRPTSSTSPVRNNVEAFPKGNTHDAAFEVQTHGPGSARVRSDLAEGATMNSGPRLPTTSSWVALVKNPTVSLS